MIIQSILDLDLYKLTVGQFIYDNFPAIEAEYLFTVRNYDKVNFSVYVEAIEFEEEIKSLQDLSLTGEEAVYLRALGYFTEDYIKFLSNCPLKLSRGEEIAWASYVNPYSRPKIKGLWCKVMLYETFVLSIANELYARNWCKYSKVEPAHAMDCGNQRLLEKIDTLKSYNSRAESRLQLVEFGTRRRLSKRWQEIVVERLNNSGVLSGTSNVSLAFRKALPVRGTFGHELPMGLQGIFRIQDSQKKAFEMWHHYWDGKLGIALDDTLGEFKFLRDFSKELAVKYDGLRHDSGDPAEWGRKRIRMYQDYGIDPKTKTLFFSDGLNIDTAIHLHNMFEGRVKTGFGIGTNLTNDTFVPVPQSVMKIVRCNDQPVAKLSNNPEKASCLDENYLDFLQYVAKVY